MADEREDEGMSWDDLDEGDYYTFFLDDLRKRVEALEAVAHEPVSIPIGNIMARLEILEGKAHNP